MDEETFLILPHPEVLTYLQRKTADYDRWLSRMRRFRDRLTISKAPINQPLSLQVGKFSTAKMGQTTVPGHGASSLPILPTVR